MTAEGSTVVSLDFDLKFPPDPDRLEKMRTAVLNCARLLFTDESFCEGIAMVANELVENAIKYGDWSSNTAQCVQVRISGCAPKVEIEAGNPVNPSTGASGVTGTLEWIRSFPSPRDAYMARLRQIAEDGSELGGISGKLGLARILFEGGGELNATLTEDHHLRLRATMHLQPDERLSA